MMDCILIRSDHVIYIYYQSTMSLQLNVVSIYQNYQQSMYLFSEYYYSQTHTFHIEGSSLHC